jgi:hypothetical protein
MALVLFKFNSCDSSEIRSVPLWLLHSFWFYQSVMWSLSCSCIPISSDLVVIFSYIFCIYVIIFNWSFIVGWWKRDIQGKPSIVRCNLARTWGCMEYISSWMGVKLTNILEDRHWLHGQMSIQLPLCTLSLYNNNFVGNTLCEDRWLSLDISFSSAHRYDRHDIANIFVKSGVKHQLLQQ